MLDAVLHLLYDCGVMWLAAAPTCPKCGGEGIRRRKKPDGKRLWHCRECCNEWIASRIDVISGAKKND